ncbi:MAG: hypothetical protein SO098_00305 [Prevotella sp.]|nr:hypothetical protein [Prevotella sp.]
MAFLQILRAGLHSLFNQVYDRTVVCISPTSLVASFSPRHKRIGINDRSNGTSCTVLSIMESFSHEEKWAIVDGLLFLAHYSAHFKVCGTAVFVADGNGGNGAASDANKKD